jgi:hypothetical protein
MAPEGWGSKDFRTVATLRWQGWQPFTLAAFTPRGDPWYLFLLRGWVNPRTIMWPEGLSQWKISVTTLGNQTHALPARNAVPHATVLPRIVWMEEHLYLLEAVDFEQVHHESRRGPQMRKVTSYSVVLFTVIFICLNFCNVERYTHNS